MDAFRSQREKIPEHIGIFAIGRRVPLLGVYEIGELERIPNEEDGCVISHEIVIAFLGIKLHRESARIPLGISRSFFAKAIPRQAPAEQKLSSLRNSIVFITHLFFWYPTNSMNPINSTNLVILFFEPHL